MYDANSNERNKHLDTSRQEREKFMLEINEATKTHNLFQKEVASAFSISLLRTPTRSSACSIGSRTSQATPR